MSLQTIFSFSFLSSLPEFIPGIHRYPLLAETKDSCNDKFGHTIEDHLGKMIKPYKAFRQLRKKGKGTFQLAEDIDIHLENNNYSISVPYTKLLNNSLEIFHTINKNGEKILAIKYKTQFIPLECYLAYVKMALSITPDEEIINLQWAIDWLCSDNHKKFNELFLVEQVLLNKNDVTPFFTRLYKRNDVCSFDIPMYAFMVSIYDFIITIYLPQNDREFDTTILKKETSIPYLPSIEGASCKTKIIEGMEYSENIFSPFQYGYKYKGEIAITISKPINNREI